MIELFQRLLGAESAWEVGADGEIARELGVSSAVAVAPADEQQCAALLRQARERRLKVIPWGGGQHQRLGNVPRPVDLVLITTRMQGVVAHDVADQTLVARAGTPLRDLIGTVRDQGQLLPLDPAGTSRATIGGVVAAGVTGPLRVGYGRAKDFLLGTLAAHPDGRLSRSGGRLVKNVTGFDLHRLYHGSLGALAVLCEVNLRLRPLPEKDATLLVGFDDLEPFDRFLVLFRRSGASAVSFHLADAASLVRQKVPLAPGDPDGQFVAALRFHGTERSVAVSLKQCLGLLESCERTFDLQLEQNEASLAWTGIRELLPGCDEKRQGAVIQLAMLPFQGDCSVLGGTIESLVALAAGAGQETVVSVEPLQGLVRLGFSRPPEETLLRELTRFAGVNGPRRLQLESAPPEWRRHLDVFFGHVKAEGPAREVKRALDPDDLLSPGRLFFGGAE
ncbi:MAG: FAD-binding oxidoreductase [Planctomycetota bacterium]